VDIRWLNAEEHRVAVEMLRAKNPDIAEPPAGTLVGKFEDGKLVAFVGVQVIPMLEPACGESYSAVRDVIIWLDGQLANQKKYVAFLTNEKLAEVVKKQFGDAGKTKQGMVFVRTRNG
jgi:hypothetical protein